MGLTARKSKGGKHVEAHFIFFKYEGHFSEPVDEGCGTGDFESVFCEG
jgi:hypothetical protein